MTENYNQNNELNQLIIKMSKIEHKSTLGKPFLQG